MRPRGVQVHTVAMNLVVWVGVLGGGYCLPGQNQKYERHICHMPTGCHATLTNNFHATKECRALPTRTGSRDEISSKGWQKTRAAGRHYPDSPAYLITLARHRCSEGPAWRHRENLGGRLQHLSSRSDQLDHPNAIGFIDSDCLDHLRTPYSTRPYIRFDKKRMSRPLMT